MKLVDVLNRTNRINLLFDFYGSLLTQKQNTFMSYYFQENFSLAEIAEQHQISRQAVYEHIRRAEKMLEQYETQLKMLYHHEQRESLLSQLESECQNQSSHENLLVLVKQLKSYI